MKSNRQFVKSGLIAILLFALSPAVDAHNGLRYLMDAVLPLEPSAPTSAPAKSSAVASNVDFGPYMREMQRRIKMNWDKPNGCSDKRVTLLFKIAKDGKLLSNSILKSSGDARLDKSAIDAVNKSAPFRPLPVEFKENDIKVQFTFECNAMGASIR